MRTGRARKARPPADPSGEGVLRRAEALLRRLESGGADPVRAAEELDRQQPALERAGRWEELLPRLWLLVDEWGEQPLRGERARAWLLLVGLCRAVDQRHTVAALARDRSQAAPVRRTACSVVGHLGGKDAVELLLDLAASPDDPTVRQAAAEALPLTGDRNARDRLAALLETDLPPTVWRAVNAALERL